MTELVRTYKLTDSGAWGWVTEEAEGGGGGSLPSWWTVDSTPGSESVEFAGAVTISPSDPAAVGLTVNDSDDVTLASFGPAAFSLGTSLAGIMAAGVGNGETSIYPPAADMSVALRDSNSVAGVEVNTSAVGFFGTTPAAKPTGVAVTAGGIHAALVTLGLIAA